LWYFLVSLNSSCRYLFNSIDGIIIETLMCLRVYFILFLFFSLFYLFTNYKEREDKKKQRKKEKITLEAHRSSDDDTFYIVRKISTRWIQRHQKISQTRNGVGHMSRPKLSGLTYLVAHLPWAVHVTPSDHRWWRYLVSLDLSIWNFSNNIDGIVIGVLMCLHIFFSFFFFLFFKFCVK